MTKTIEKIEKDDVELALNTLKKKKQEAGAIPNDNKKIVIINGKIDFKGKSLKVNKGLFKNGQNYTYKAGTKWEDIDNFGKANIRFNESDFN